MNIPKTDIHVHPFLKPYGHSFYGNNNPDNPNNPASPWMVDKNTRADDIRENLVGIPTYRQSDLTSTKSADVRLIVNSLYPIERGFFQFKKNVWGQATDKVAGVAIQEMITEFGRPYVEAVRSASFDYLADFNGQLAFVQRMEKTTGAHGNFKLLNNGQSLAQDLVQTNDLLVVNSIEGVQSLCRGNNPEAPGAWDGIETTIAQLKAAHGRPFFITFAHHFYNGLCSHCESLFSIRMFIEGQQRGMESLVAQGISNKEINPLGHKIIHLLLDTANGQRILMDVKHMSEGARNEFYALRNKDYPQVPIVYSHGAAKRYYHQTINLNNHDIVEIAKSGGLIGLELDQRILGYNDDGARFLRWMRNGLSNDRKQNRHWAEIFVLNLVHIAEVCSDNNLDPWANLCIGSDYDGVINPLNEFRTISEIGDLCATTADLLHEFSRRKDWRIDHDSSLSMEDVVYKLAYKNVYEFVGKHFK